MDLTHYPYLTERVAVVARNGVAATSQSLASQAGLRVLRSGGNAVDAALAMATTLTVVEPTSNGIGGDLFALVWDGTRLHGLNASGRAPAALTVQRVRDAGHDTMPARGWLTVTVPGAPRGWRDLHDRWGLLPFKAVFEDAIRYADEGYALSPILAQGWQASIAVDQTLRGAEYAGWRPTFAPDGFGARPGEVWASPAHARTLRAIARSGAEDFYQGELAERIAAFAADTGGTLTTIDLAQHNSTWVDPITTNYRGYDVWEIPPSGQGLTALVALNILEGFDLAQYARDSTEAFHLQIEALKLAFADAFRYIADPADDQAGAEALWAGLLDKQYAERRRALVDDTAATYEHGEPQRGGTVYLCAADHDGMMVSLIQSNYLGFGSGIVVPDTGIALHSRASGFRLDPGHPNQLAPGKRPYHTIIPGFLTKDGAALGPFGVMGGHMQPQGHVQMVVNMVDWGFNPQASLDAPRWFWSAGRAVAVEQSTPTHVVRGLLRRGHEIEVAPEPGRFGRGQIIRRQPNGVYVAGSEGRADGSAAGY
jgi:gamma-glutamyltranspeptidase / glutathione hydrolase